MPAGAGIARELCVALGGLTLRGRRGAAADAAGFCSCHRATCHRVIGARGRTPAVSVTKPPSKLYGSISSNGSIPSFAKKRVYSRPGADAGAAGRIAVCGLVVSISPGFDAEPTLAAPFCMLPLRKWILPAPWAGPAKLLRCLAFAASRGLVRTIWEGVRCAPLRRPNMDPGYVVVKRESTTYCVAFLVTAPVIDNLHDLARGSFT